MVSVNMPAVLKYNPASRVKRMAKEFVGNIGGRLPVKCDVVIVNYNAGHWLVESVASAFASGVHRVIVVDNASLDNSLDELNVTCAGEGLIILRNSENLGFSTACNLGARITQSPAVLFLNPDCRLEQGALDKMLDALSSASDIGMVGGYLSNLDGSEQIGGRRSIPDPRRAFARAFGLSRLAKWFPMVFGDFSLHEQAIPDNPFPVEAISGACMLVKKSAIDDVGLWDEEYFLHCEDLDWCMRFSLRGWKIMYVPDAKVTHVRGACSRSRPVFVEWHKHCGMIRFYRKFFRQQYHWLLWGAVVVGVWVRFAMVAVYLLARKLMSLDGGRRV